MNRKQEVCERLYAKRIGFLKRFECEPNIIRLSWDAFIALNPHDILSNPHNTTIWGIKIEIDDTKKDYMAVGYLIE